MELPVNDDAGQSAGSLPALAANQITFTPICWATFADQHYGLWICLHMFLSPLTHRGESGASYFQPHFPPVILWHLPADLCRLGPRWITVNQQNPSESAGWWWQLIAWWPWCISGHEHRAKDFSKHTSVVASVQYIIITHCRCLCKTYRQM